MPSKVYSGAITGLNAQIVEVETDVSFGLRSFNIVGLPDKAVRESKQRIKSAIKSSNISSPQQKPRKVLVNLAPADLKKEGTLYDLPIAVSYLAASNQIKFSPEGKIFIGELSLDGRLRPIKGVISFALMAKDKGVKELILPKQNAKEASLVKSVKAVGIESLKELIAYLEGKISISSPKPEKENLTENLYQPINLSWIKGQNYAKRALEITAAGGHNMLMSGPPGSGKTLLAKAIPSILPKLNFSEALEVSKIYSISGLLKKEKPLLDSRPFRAPHHTSSKAALLGGGNPPRPGEITLAHRGVLFMDEFPEFNRDVLEGLRQPIESGNITIRRAKASLTLPASFMLVVAANPCPCGHLNDPENPCTCTNSQIAKYKRKLSGPLMDRIDIFVEVPQVKYKKLTREETSSQNQETRRKVEKARKIQKQRFQNNQIFTNSEMNIPQIKKYCSHGPTSKSLLKKYVDSGKLSARGYHRVLKVARTIADLEGKKNISKDHIAESLMYRIRES